MVHAGPRGFDGDLSAAADTLHGLLTDSVRLKLQAGGGPPAERVLSTDHPGNKRLP